MKKIGVGMKKFFKFPIYKEREYDFKAGKKTSDCLKSCQEITIAKIYNTSLISVS